MDPDGFQKELEGIWGSLLRKNEFVSRENKNTCVFFYFFNNFVMNFKLMHDNLFGYVGAIMTSVNWTGNVVFFLCYGKKMLNFRHKIK